MSSIPTAPEVPSPVTQYREIIDILATGLARLALENAPKNSLNPAKKPLSFPENPGSVCNGVNGNRKRRVK